MLIHEHCSTESQMFIVADTNTLTQDQIITPAQAQEMKSRSREAMATLAINMILCFGILSATAGLIFWLASATAVAICGLLFLASGIFILSKKTQLFDMFGNAAALIGSGMMLGGGAIELVDKYKDIAEASLILGGILVAGLAGYSFLKNNFTTRFVTGSIYLMGITLHLVGCYYAIEQNNISGLPLAMMHLYASGIIVVSGWLLNVRTITVLAIIPFAQILDAGTAYFHAAYVFSSPESTLSILQLTLLITACLWLSKRTTERTARHVRVISVIAFIIANLSALVGSIWGDKIGESLWGPGRWYSRSTFDSYQDWQAAKGLFAETAWTISADLYSILWAVALLITVIFAAHKNNRGLFNAGMTFAGIHAYTQMFETFADEPLAWVIGGLAAIPLAWSLWRLNHWFINRKQKTHGIEKK